MTPTLTRVRKCTRWMGGVVKRTAVLREQSRSQRRNASRALLSSEAWEIHAGSSRELTVWDDEGRLLVGLEAA